MNHIKGILAFLCAALFAGAAHAEDVRVGGGAAPIENIFKKIQEPIKAKGITLTLSDQGPDMAFKDLDAGKVDAAAAGLALNDWFDLMQKKGYEVKDKSIYKQRVVGRDKIRVLMHKDLNKVKSLSKEQLKGIFTGKIKNWKEVGGPDQAVVIVNGTKIPGTVKLWQERIMDKEEYAKGMDATESVDIALKVKTNKGAISIGSLGGASADEIYAIEDIPDVSRPITVITKGSPSPAVEKVFDFISKDGQKFITR